MNGKFALIVANTEYTDPGLAQLTAPSKDAENFAHVLKEKTICAFDDVRVLLDQSESVVRAAMDEFFDEKRPDDLLVLYFSGHGVRDEFGALYLAVKNTNRFRLRSTAIKSDYVREAMDQSRSKRQVLILDCCNSGAFAQGTKAATGTSIGIASAFEAGYGRIILTASDSTQFAWEGDKIIGETDNSLFTHFLVKGLEGEADLNSDGRITVDELYDYAYEKVKLATSKQTPSKFSSKQQGEIVLRANIRVEDTRPAQLPAALLDSLENPFADIRLGAVQQLIKLSNGKNLGLALSAREALQHIAEKDDSRTVSRAAFQALESIPQSERLALQKAEVERKAGAETEGSLAEQKIAEEHLTKAKMEAERPAEEKRSANKRLETDREVEKKVNKIPPWLARMLVGAASGIAITIVLSLYGDSAVVTPFSCFAASAIFYGLVGFITYPHKLSIVILVLGFLIAGFLAMNSVGSGHLAVFMTGGILVGLPAGALLSRILYLLKVVFYRLKNKIDLK